MMTECVGTTFPVNWQYGPDELHIFCHTADQINKAFPDQQNLLINTTWFGPQFNNGQWDKVQDLIKQGRTFDNLFLLSVIDPMYLEETDLEYISRHLSVRKIYRIGMFADSPYEWNFHSFTVAQHCPQYDNTDLMLKDARYVYMLYQRKPRLHRVQITNLLIEQNLHSRGVLTLGNNQNSSYDWSQGESASLITIEDSPANYKHNGKDDDFGGIPNDLVSLGRIDLWQQHFINIVSETEFDEWRPRFITEKTWKPIIGLRPFIIHGQRSIYKWLEGHGFRTYNRWWPQIPVETSEDQHGMVIAVVKFLCDMSPKDLLAMYQDMLPDLYYNKQRYLEFAKEQKHKMENLFI